MSRRAIDGNILTEVTLHLPSLWCVSSRTVVDGYILTEVTLHLHLLYDTCHVYNHPGQLHSDRGYTTPTLTMTCVMWTIIQYISRRLHSNRGYTTPSLYDVCLVYNHPVHQQTVTFWQRLHCTYTFSMMCVMGTIIQYISRRLHSDRGYTAPTPSLWCVSWVQSSSTSAEGYILTEVILHLLSMMCVMCTIIQDNSRRLHSDRGYTTPTLSLLRVSCVQSSSTSADGYILTEVTLHLHLSMMCVMCTMMQSLSRRLYSDIGYTTPTHSLWRVLCVQRLHYTYPLNDVCHVYSLPGLRYIRYIVHLYNNTIAFHILFSSVKSKTCRTCKPNGEGRIPRPRHSQPQPRHSQPPPRHTRKKRHSRNPRPRHSRRKRPRQLVDHSCSSGNCGKL